MAAVAKLWTIFGIAFDDLDLPHKTMGVRSNREAHQFREAKQAIVPAADEAEARALGTNDPTIKAGAGFQFEAYPMPQVILRERA